MGRWDEVVARCLSNFESLTLKIKKDGSDHAQIGYLSNRPSIDEQLILYGKNNMPFARLWDGMQGHAAEQYARNTQ